MSSASATSKAGRSPSQNRDSSAGPAGAKTPIAQSIRDMLFRNGSSSSNGGGGAAAGKSPVSPARISRLQEKEEMQNLNDRLVIYIDTVRRLEADNNRLQMVVNAYSENSTRDISEIKELYERELEDAKRLIDDLAKEKAKFEIDVNKYKADADEAVAKLAKREKEFKKLDADLKASQNEAQEFKSRYEALQTEAARRNDELAQLKPLAADLEKQLAKLKKQLEDETLLRVDLENKNQTLKEDLQFKTQLYDREIGQLRTAKQVEIEQVDVRLRDEYDSRLVNELQRIRDETDSKIAEMKDDVERRYQTKLAEFQSNARRDSQYSTAMREELSSVQSKNEELQGDLKSLQTKLTSYENKLKDLEEKLKKANARYDADMTSKDNEIAELRKEIQEMLLEYQELYDIKIALDMEIGAYRKLLESEEQRLNISTAQASALGSSYIEPSSGGTRSAKKRRIAATLPDQEEQVVASSSGAGSVASYKQTHVTTSGIEISEHDFDGKHVKITNTTDKDIPIGGWQLKRLADGQETDHKFHKSTVLKPGQTITVWSSNSEQTHSPPNDIVMNSQRWFTGDRMVTLLVDKESNEQAKRESSKTVRSVEKKLRATPTNGSPSTSAVSRLFGLWSK